MAKVKTARDLFYHVDDVMRLLGYSRSKSYKIIAQLNRELEAAGFCTCDGRVSRRQSGRPGSSRCTRECPSWPWRPWRRRGWCS